jgi:hypothetical protein
MFKEKREFLSKKYSENEGLYNALFFVGGVLFDVFTLDEIDSLFGVLQQLFYIITIGVLLYFDLIHRYTPLNIKKGFQTIWEYRSPLLHFLLGGLLSVYSLFFIKSASFFSSFGFIAFMLVLLIGNELQVVQKQKISLKIGIYSICIFSFFSMIFPVLLGHVGKLPFFLSIMATVLFVSGFYKLIYKKIENKDSLRKALLLPSFSIMFVFSIFYYLGWIPPVPLSVKEIGIYHDIKRTGEGDYQLFYEKPDWKFWLSGDQNFTSHPGEKVYIFARIFSPARFKDTLYLNWQLYIPKKGWVSTDRVPINISGGRKSGYRGYSYKENYPPGEWRVLVETSDMREVGRIRFDVEKVLTGRKTEITKSLVR